MKKLMVSLTAGALLLIASNAFAHTPLCDCFDNGDNTVTCEGGFSDGSSAAGVAMTVKGSDGKVLQKGAMNENGEYTFNKPAGDYMVVFDSGEGHQVEVNGADIVE